MLFKSIVFYRISYFVALREFDYNIQLFELQNNLAGGLIFLRVNVLKIPLKLEILYTKTSGGF